MPPSRRIELRATPEMLKQLATLQKKTGLDRSNVIRLAIAEMTERKTSA